MKINKKINGKGIAGITLIALVITIIVLLILAGISISMLSGDNSILKRATTAKKNTEKTQIVENAKTDVLGQIVENNGEDISESQFKAILGKFFKEDSIPDDFPEDLSTVELTTLNERHKVLASEIYDGTLRALGPGLYYAGTNNLIKSWDELLKENPPMLKVSDGILTKASFNIDTQVKLIVDKSVTSVGNMGGILKLDEIKFPDTITAINPGAFSGCNNLKKVTIISGSIGSGAFAGCSAIEIVNLGNKVTYIDSGAFYGCSSLKKIEIPDSVTNLGDESFKGCTSLEDIKIGNGGINIKQNIFSDDNTIKTIDIKSGTLGAGLFNGRNNLETVKLGKNVNMSESSIFGACKNLTNVYLEEGITSIGEFSFGQCEKLTNINIPNSVVSIGDRAFQSCPLNTIFINSSSIGEQAFECSSLTSITIATNVRNIGKQAFGDLKSQKVDVNIYNGIITIGEYSFANYTDHPSSFTINLPNSVTTIEKQAFKDCEMTTIKIPKSVTSIENDAFKNCNNLQNIIIEKGSALTAPNNKWGANNATVTIEE